MWWWSQMYSRGSFTCAPYTPLASQIFHNRQEYLTLPNSICNIQLVSCNSFQDMMGPKSILGVLHPSDAPSGKYFIPENSTWHPLSVCVTFQLCSSNSFRNIWGPKCTIRGAAPLTRPWRKIFHTRKLYCTWPYVNVRKISTF